jgi:hypothetical protein
MYTEWDLQQEVIGREEFYCRYTLEFNVRKLDVGTHLLHLFPTRILMR